MFVSDLRHFLDLPDGTPGPARRMAEHLGDIVRAATAGDAGSAWVSALPCRRRPGRRPCPGRLILRRVVPDAVISWQCGRCGDAGIITDWADTPYDLRRHQLTLPGVVHQVVVADDTAAALRGVRLLDPDGERLVFRMRDHPDGAVLGATADDLDQLADSVAAEANHEPNPRRRRHFDAALDALTAAAESLHR